ncbi:unnamed protein product [Caenorhabditis bovis]|uniref:Uncharacterized protein n=1 Tax=Caenorhabditis bovis TaxID=2654633 RepID=A0A8S1FBN4_9PELO|nr:unnamed protein product [Caenorhabditis bovis]
MSLLRVSDRSSSESDAMPMTSSNSVASATAPSSTAAAIPRSSSDLTVLPAASRSRCSREPSLRGSSSRNSTSSMRELHMVGPCVNCELDFKCSCCWRCSHVSFAYLPSTKRIMESIECAAAAAAAVVILRIVVTNP